MALLFRYFSQDLKTAGKGSTVDCRHYLLDPACNQQVQVETNKKDIWRLWCRLPQGAMH